MARVEGGGGIEPALPGMALGWVDAAMLEAWYYEDAGAVELMSKWQEDAGMKSRKAAQTAHRSQGVLTRIIEFSRCSG
jgi:hypothetical protein